MLCSIDARNQQRRCPKCGGAARRTFDAGLYIENCSIVNCGAGVRMEGGHAVIDGLQIVDTPTGFQLERGATVDMRNVSQTFSNKQGPKRKRSKTKRSKRKRSN